MASIPIPDPNPSLRALRRLRDRLIELADTELRLGRLRLQGTDPTLAQRSFRLALAATDVAREVHRMIAACTRYGSGDGDSAERTSPDVGEQPQDDHGTGDVTPGSGSNLPA